MWQGYPADRIIAKWQPNFPVASNSTSLFLLSSHSTADLVGNEDGTEHQAVIQGPKLIPCHDSMSSRSSQTLQSFSSGKSLEGSVGDAFMVRNELQFSTSVHRFYWLIFSHMAGQETQCLCMLRKKSETRYLASVCHDV